MKQVVVLSTRAHEPSLKEIFRTQPIPVFSRTDVEGIVNKDIKADTSNWFVASRESDFSVMYFAFVEDNVATSILSKVDTWNESNHAISAMHAYSVQVDKYVK